MPNDKNMWMDELTILDRRSLVDFVRRGGRPRYLFFWRPVAPRSDGIGEHCLSQWWPATFRVNGITYPTARALYDG